MLCWLTNLTRLLFGLVHRRFAESIPSSFLQIYAYMASGHQSESALVSIAVSIATISFGSTLICFDYDLDPNRRLACPAFYGYIPNDSKKKNLVFFTTFLFTACHVSVRLLGIVVLAIVNPLLVTVFLGGDMLFFFLVKVLRKDLRYFMNVNGGFAWVITFGFRLIVKIMADFTAMVQLRNPNELGGMYWTACLLLGQTTTFVAVYLYLLEKSSTFSKVDLWSSVVALEGLFVVSFAIFVLSIDPKYRRTFFSTATAKQFHVQRFREATSDQAKIFIFKLHPSYYANIWGEVSEWVEENYEIWDDEKPVWFTARVKASIPREMVTGDDARLSSQ